MKVLFGIEQENRDVIKYVTVETDKTLQEVKEQLFEQFSSNPEGRRIFSTTDVELMQVKITNQLFRDLPTTVDETKRNKYDWPKSETFVACVFNKQGSWAVREPTPNANGYGQIWCSLNHCHTYNTGSFE
jgi:hypothetical protein